MREHAIESRARGVIVDQIVRELGELIEDDVLAVAGELGAFVIDFLDVAFGARRADDIGGIADPLRQPIEALAAHPRRQHGDAAAADDAGYGNAAAAVIPGGWPDRAVLPRIETAGHQSGYQARIGGEHLVRADHGKAPAEENDDGCLYAGESLRQDHMPRHRHPRAARRIVEPVHPPEILLAGIIRPDRLQAALDGGRDQRRIGELLPRRQSDACRAQRLDSRPPAPCINDLGLDEGCHVADAACGSIARAALERALAANDAR